MNSQKNLLLMYKGDTIPIPDNPVTILGNSMTSRFNRK